MKKKILAVALAAAMALSTPMSASAAWRKDTVGNWQWSENGSLQTGWKSIGGRWYHFQDNAVMSTGWIQDGSTWYYLDESGAMKTGWLFYNGTWYYLNPNGAMATGWKNVGGKWYYLKSWGGMSTGWAEVNGKHYFLDSSGVMQSGIIEVNGKVYYLDESGAMVTGTVKIDRKRYEFAETGESVGLRTPQPEKAFTTSGEKAEITVEGGISGGGGIGGGGSSGGGNSSGGGSEGGDSVISESRLREEFDKYLVSKCAEVNENLGDKASFVFDKKSHVVDVTINNLDSIIGFIRTGATTIVSKFPLSSFTKCSVNGSEYDGFTSVDTLKALFKALDVSVVDALEALNGKSVKVSLQGKLKKSDGKIDTNSAEYTTVPYTFRFTVSQSAEKPEKNYYFGDIENHYNPAATCQETDEGILVTVKPGYEVDEWIRLYGLTTDTFRSASLALDNAFEKTNSTWSLNTSSRWMRYTSFIDFKNGRYRHPDKWADSARKVQMSYDEQTNTQTYIYLDYEGVQLYTLAIQYSVDGRSFLLRNLTFEDFNVEPDAEGNCLIGGIWTKASSGSVTEEPEILFNLNKEPSEAYSLDENGLQIQITSDDEYFAHNFKVSFSSPIILNGNQIKEFEIRGLSEKSEEVQGRLFTGEKSYYKVSYDTNEDSVRTYHFTDSQGTETISVRLNLSEDCRTLTLPDLTSDIMAWKKVTVNAYSYPLAMVFAEKDGEFENIEYSWDSEKDGLIVTAPEGTHFGGEATIGFDKDTIFNDTVIEGIGINVPEGITDSIYFKDIFCDSGTAGRVNGKYIGDIPCSTSGEDKTFLFKIGTESSFSFKMKFSADRKQIVFYDLTQTLLTANCTNIILDTVADDTSYVHTEEELREAVDNPYVKSIVLKNQIVLTQSLMIDRMIDFQNLSYLFSNTENAILIFESVGSSDIPIRMEGLEVGVQAINSHLRITFHAGFNGNRTITLKDSILEIFDGAEYLYTVEMDMDVDSEGISKVVFADMPNDKIVITAGRETSKVTVAEGISAIFVSYKDGDCWKWTNKAPEIQYYFEDEKSEGWFEVSESGLGLQIPEGNGPPRFAGDFSVSFSFPIVLDGKNIKSFEIRGLSEDSDKVSGTLNTGTESYSLVSYETDENNGRTYHFSNSTDTISIQLQMAADCMFLKLPDLTREVLTGNTVEVRAHGSKLVSAFTDLGSRLSPLAYSFENSTYLVLPLEESFSFGGQVTIAFEKDWTFGDTVIEGIGSDPLALDTTKDSIVIQNIFCGESGTSGTVNGIEVQQISCTVDGEEATFVFNMEEGSNFSIRMKLSADRKQILFYDFTQALLGTNGVTLILDVVLDAE